MQNGWARAEPVGPPIRGERWDEMRFGGPRWPTEVPAAGDQVDDGRDGGLLVSRYPDAAKYTPGAVL